MTRPNPAPKGDLPDRAGTAFPWLGKGGFTSEYLGGSALDVRALKLLTGRFHEQAAG